MIQLTPLQFQWLQLALGTAIPALIEKLTNRAATMTDEEMEQAIATKRQNVQALRADIREIMKGG